MTPDPLLQADQAAVAKVQQRIAQQEQAARLVAFEARMATKALREAAMALENVKPATATSTPVEGTRPCRACAGTGKVRGMTCPSCMGAGWKWLPPSEVLP